MDEKKKYSKAYLWSGLFGFIYGGTAGFALGAAAWEHEKNILGMIICIIAVLAFGGLSGIVFGAIHYDALWCKGKVKGPPCIKRSVS